jgi:hypothetical protein
MLLVLPAFSACGTHNTGENVSLAGEQLGNIIDDHWIELNFSGKELLLPPGDATELRRALSELLLNGGSVVEERKSANEIGISFWRSQDRDEFLLSVEFRPDKRGTIVEVYLKSRNETFRFVADELLVDRVFDERRKFAH